VGTRAFTLIEMVLAIGVAALVLLAIHSVLFGALRLRDAASDLVDATTPVDMTLTTIRRDLQCVVTPTNGTTKILSGDFRAGDVQSYGVSGDVAVEMYTATGALSANAPWADIQRVTYELKPPTDGTTGQGKDLVRSTMRNLLSTTTPEVDDQLLLSGVESIKFSCYDGTQWQDTWDTTGMTSTLYTNLPTAVRVDLQMTGGNSQGPIEILVPIDAQPRTNMVFTATTGS